MKRIFLSVSLMISCSSSGSGTDKSIATSTFCTIYKCTAAGNSDGVYKYRISNQSITKNTLLFINTNKKYPNRYSILLGEGSLLYGPSPNDCKMVDQFYKFYGLKDLDIKTELFAANALVNNKAVDYAVIREFTFSGIQMVAYIRSSPDQSIKPEKGRIEFGIMPKTQYPPSR